MKTISTYEALGQSDKGAVIALGNFDGVHRGHQAVIKAAQDIANAQSAPLGIGLFRPHPFRFFKPDAPAFRLMSSRLRAQLLPQYGIDVLYEIPFDDSLKSMDDEQFVDIVLRQGLGATHIVVGNDFKYGKDRCGDIASLKAHCSKHAIEVTGLKPIGLHEFYGKYGSTEIRKALKDGDVLHAAHMLSRPWMVDGIVQKGQQRGRTINFPTANLEFGDLVEPKFGVYAVELRIDGQDVWHPGVANTGTRPTVSGEQARLEVHIFDFDRDIYGQMVEVRFRSFIRNEKKFESFDALKQQITKDALGARAVLGVLSAP